MWAAAPPGFAVERHPVPQAHVRADGTVSATDPAVYHRPGEGGPTARGDPRGDRICRPRLPLSRAREKEGSTKWKGGDRRGFAPRPRRVGVGPHPGPLSRAGEGADSVRPVRDRPAAARCRRVEAGGVPPSAPERWPGLRCPRPAAGRPPARSASCATRITGERVAPGGVPLYTDARRRAAGIAVVPRGAGPHAIEGADAHRADERPPALGPARGHRGRRAGG